MFTKKKNGRVDERRSRRVQCLGDRSWIEPRASKVRREALFPLALGGARVCRVESAPSAISSAVRGGWSLTGWSASARTTSRSPRATRRSARRSATPPRRAPPRWTSTPREGSSSAGPCDASSTRVHPPRSCSSRATIPWAAPWRSSRDTASSPRHSSTSRTCTSTGTSAPRDPTPRKATTTRPRPLGSYRTRRTRLRTHLFRETRAM